MIFNQLFISVITIYDCDYCYDYDFPRTLVPLYVDINVVVNVVKFI